MRKTYSIAFAAFLSAAPLFAADPGDENARVRKQSTEHARLIIRIDDIGFCHAANMGAERVLNEGVCTSISVIVNTPWLDEAVQILKSHPEVSVGVHLTLNAEWREYRWGPVLPQPEVPSLVDADGRFFPTRKAFFANEPKTDEVEKELRAQIQLALRKGLPLSYLDYHMGTAMSTPALQQVVERLAAEFKLGISKYFGETYAPTVYRATPDRKLTEAIQIIEQMTESTLYLLVLHPGANTPEMAAMTDLNATGVKPMAAHRQAVTDLLCSPAFKSAIERQNIQLTNYSELRARGLQHMTRPWLAEPYRQTQPTSDQAKKSNP